MAGYIFTVSGWDEFCAADLKFGYFTPFTASISDEATDRGRKILNKILCATFGDIITMKPGDNIYFLSKRKIYGIGTAVPVGEDCKYDNYGDSSALLPDFSIDPNDYMTTEDTRARWVVFFEPSPYFFTKGADMDDVLRYRPSAFKMLRAFEGLTFIKIDDEENRALKEYISLLNEDAYDDIDDRTFPYDDSVHIRLAGQDLDRYTMDITKVLADEENKEYVLSEMFIESLLLQGIAKGTVATLGDWDYLSHQLIASPFKPLKYIDKIDIFGYRFSTRYEDSPKLITKYLLVEMKKGPVNGDALEQTMQYVDWICQEYAAGDYSKIEAYVVGSRATRNIGRVIEESCQRSYIAETHPVKPMKWNDIKIVQYSLDDGVSFEVIEP